MQKNTQWKLACILVAITFVVSMSPLTAATNKLMSYVPKSANLIINLNVKTILDAPTVKALLKDSDSNADYTEFTAKLKKYGLKMDDIAKQMLVFAYGDKSKPSFGLVADTKITDSLLKKILDDEFSGGKAGSAYKIETIAGKKAFILKSSEMKNPLMNKAISQNKNFQDEQAIVYLSPNTALFCPKAGLKNILSFISKKQTANKNAKIKKQLTQVNTNAEMWGIFEITPTAIMGGDDDAKGDTKNNSQAMSNPGKDIRGGSFSLSFNGKTKEDIAITTSLLCKNAQSANMMQMQMQGLVMMLCSMGFQKNPQLGMQLAQALKFGAKGKNIQIEANLSKVLIDKLKAYSEKQGKNNKPSRRGVSIKRTDKSKSTD